MLAAPSGIVGGSKRRAAVSSTEEISAGAAEGAITFASDEVHRPGFFDGAIDGVAFAECFVRVEHQGTVRRSHSPEHRARHCFDFTYQVNRPHPMLDRFFEEVFEDVSEDERATRIALLQEFFGACLVGIATSYQKCLVLLGTGGNGKSQIVEVARALFGTSAVVSLAPQQWGERFMLSRLVGVLANFVDEMPEKEIVGGDTFKAVISGEPVHSERKQKDPFDFRPHAGHVFSTNSLPGTADHSEGFWRRMLVCPFTRDMTKASCYRPNAAQQVIDSELPAVAAWALAGAARLVRQGAYSIPEGGCEALAKWRCDSDTVALFIQEQTRPCNGAEAGWRASILYRSYQKWILDNGHRAVSSKEFAKRMAANGKSVVHRSDGNWYPVVPATV